MSKHLGKILNNIMEENAAKRAAVITDKLYIVGTIHDYEECENCHECVISLKDVKIKRVDDMCNCGINDCACESDNLLEFKWFNININAIIGFSIIK